MGSGQLAFLAFFWNLITFWGSEAAGTFSRWQPCDKQAGEKGGGEGEKETTKQEWDKKRWERSWGEGKQEQIRDILKTAAAHMYVGGVSLPNSRLTFCCDTEICSFFLSFQRNTLQQLNTLSTPDSHVWCKGNKTGTFPPISPSSAAALQTWGASLLSQRSVCVETQQQLLGNRSESVWDTGAEEGTTHIVLEKPVKQLHRCVSELTEWLIAVNAVCTFFFIWFVALCFFCKVL